MTANLKELREALAALVSAVDSYIGSEISIGEFYAAKARAAAVLSQMETPAPQAEQPVCSVWKSLSLHGSCRDCGHTKEEHEGTVTGRTEQQSGHIQEIDKGEERVDVYKGKYTVILRSDGTSTALRYGEEWPAYRNETQLDNLTCALARDLIEARGGEAEARLKGIHEAFTCCRQIVRSYGPSDLTQQVRRALCQMMDHYEGTAGAIMPPVKRE